MSENSGNDEIPNGAPPQGTHIRMDRFTVTNTSRFPFPEMPHMAPPGFGFPPSFNPFTHIVLYRYIKNGLYSA